MSAIEVEQITKTYKIGTQETHALRGVSASFNEGEFTALVGPSGSGKTTLLQIIGCLDQPTSGALRIKGQDVSRLNADQRADLRKGTIGFVFQFFALIPGLSAYENVELPLLLNGEGTAARKARVLELLAAVGLSERAHHRPDQLSGGEQQRVAVARALAHDPAIVFADEPTGSLDRRTGTILADLLFQLAASNRTTLVLVTHDEQLASRCARIVHMGDGRIVP